MVASETPHAGSARPEDVVLEPRDWVRWSLPGLIWGSSFYLIAEGLDAFSPALITWLRIMLGFAVILSVPAARTPIPPTTWPRLVVLGVIWMAIPLTLFPFAEERVSSSVTGMMNGSMPIFAAAVAAIIARNIPPGRQIGGLTVGLLGIVLIAMPSWSQGSSSASGIVMILAAMVCYGIAINLAGPLQRQIGSLPVIGRSLGVAGLCTAPFGIMAFADSSFEWGSALAVAVLGVFGTGLAYVLMASNAGQYGSTRAASTTYLIPGVSLALGLALRGEEVALLAVIGSLVAVSGAYLVNSTRAS